VDDRPYRPATVFDFRWPLARGRAHALTGEVLGLLPVHPTFAGLRLLPAAEEQLDFLVAPDQRRRARAQRLEPAHRAAFAQDKPGTLRLGEAGKLLRPEVPQIEQSADLPARRSGDHQCVRRSKGLQPGSEVRRLADDLVLKAVRHTEVLIDEMRAAEAARLIAMNLPVAGEPRAAARLANLSDRLGNWAQMLAIANGWLRDRVGREPLLGWPISRIG
jgi:hypothetical protein